MKLSGMEIKSQGIDLRNWLAFVQLACKNGDAPIFKLNGPVSMPTRLHKPSRFGAQTMTSARAYVGDEKFRIGAVFQETLINEDAVVLSVMMVPADMGLVQEISGVTLTLATAMEQFTGLEAWIMGLANIPTPARQLEAKVRAGMPARALASEEEIEERRGSW
jgi:hypothetical protein